MPHLKLPKGVVALGLVSLFMDLSSEMIHSLLPVFLVAVLGASALSVGFIESIAEATAAIAKVFSGVLSDWIGRRKPLVLLGYGLAALTNPLFPLATGIGAVLTVTFSRPHRQGDSRRAARCATRRHHAAGTARGGLWAAPSDGYGGRFRGAVIGHGTDDCHS